MRRLLWPICISRVTPGQALLIPHHQTRFSRGFYAHPLMLNHRAGSHAKYPTIDVNNMLYAGDFNAYSRHHIAFKR